ncbi:MAG: SUF system Fe-S cluster assembly regulator [Burkholderiales bacterium]
MLRMSKLTDYGTVVMTYLARNGKGIHTANEIAESVQVALPTTSKLLKSLARAGLVTSTRGTHGGYFLARPAAQISIAEVIAALEGPIGLTECASTAGTCEQEQGCSVRGNWQRINNVVVGALQHVSLAEMVAPLFPVDTSRLKGSFARKSAPSNY